MKRLAVAILMASSSVHAVNPVQGWYGGILLGVNYTPNTNYNFPTTFTIPSTIPVTVPHGTPLSLTYGHMGQLAMQFGYRHDKYRVEGQFLYNNSPYSSLKLNNVTILAPKTSSNYTFKGNTDTGALLLNGFYDFLPSDPASNFAPYIGLGLGYAYVMNGIKLGLWNTSGHVGDVRLNEHTTSAAGQAIVGASYFMDDFASFGLDFRYFTTAAKSTLLDARVQVYSVNLSFNGAFNFA